MNTVSEDEYRRQELIRKVHSVLPEDSTFSVKMILEISKELFQASIRFDPKWNSFYGVYEDSEKTPVGLIEAVAKPFMLKNGSGGTFDFYLDGKEISLEALADICDRYTQQKEYKENTGSSESDTLERKIAYVYEHLPTIIPDRTAKSCYKSDRALAIKESIQFTEEIFDALEQWKENHRGW